MVIIDSKKDYYDYLVGINGRDDDIVYDRRSSIKIVDSYEIQSNTSYSLPRSINLMYGLFNPKPCQFDVPRTLHENRFSKFMKKHYGDKGKEGEEYGLLLHCMVEIGLKQYIIAIDRYLTESNIVKIEPSIKEIREITVENKGERPVVGIYSCHRTWENEYRVSENLFRRYDSNKRNYAFDEVIFTETWVTGVVPPEEAYNEIYNYIIATKDKKIVDSRTDVEKAQSHGFNKESFRNPVRVKDLNKQYKNRK